MFQRLPIEFPQLKMGNASENALNKTREFLYSLYWKAGTTCKNVLNEIRKIIYSFYRG